jgi:hypothetical protein
MLALQRLTGEYGGYVLVTLESRFCCWQAYRHEGEKLSRLATYGNKRAKAKGFRQADVTSDCPCCSGVFRQGKKKATLSSSLFYVWLREPDLNRRPSGYEPDELPDCSIPRLCGGILQPNEDVSTFNAQFDKITAFLSLVRLSDGSTRLLCNRNFGSGPSSMTEFSRMNGMRQASGVSGAKTGAHKKGHSFE